MPRVLTLPLTVAANGSIATISQDHPAEVGQSVALLLDTRPGERRTLPDYGLTDMLFEGYDTDDIADAVTEWEPRATTDIVQTVTTAAGVQALTVHLTEET